MADAPHVLWTIGHSIHPLRIFLDLLNAHGIRQLADIRRFPASRRLPHFDARPLADSLAGEGIGYAHLSSLGGRRVARKDSRNTGWRNLSFRGYADYMETSDFSSGMEDLLRMAKVPTALMCSEALWWKCHRALVADALKVRGCSVRHILPSGEAREHPWTAPARVVDGRLSYAAPPENRLL